MNSPVDDKLAEAELRLWNDAHRTLVGWARMRGQKQEAVSPLFRYQGYKLLDTGLWVNPLETPALQPRRDGGGHPGRYGSHTETLFWGRRAGYLLGSLSQWVAGTAIPIKMDHHDGPDGDSRTLTLPPGERWPFTPAETREPRIHPRYLVPPKAGR